MAILYLRDDVSFHSYADTTWCVDRRYLHKSIGTELDTLVQIFEEWIMLQQEATRRWNLATKDNLTLAYNLCRDYSKQGRCRDHRCVWMHLERK